MGGIDEVLQRILPSELASHCRTMSISETTLTIEANSSAWAMRLRYLVPELKQQLRTFPTTASIQFIQCRVRPAKKATAAPKRAPMALSRSSCEVIRSSAESISSPELKAALLRLATHHK